MNRSKRAQRKATAQAVAFFGALIAVVFFCAWAFPQIDCNTARNGLAFIERCEASEDCRLTAREANLKSAYTRLEIKSCPKEKK